MNQATISDEIARQTAVDPTRSFIVQAPAGSGKTELLTQRFLALLARVQQAPEEIIALTFTKKAAAEMQARILLALQQAASNIAPTSTHQQQTIQLANAVLDRDQQEQWHLLENPNRLNIQTIDALCFKLVQQMPILSQLGSFPTISEDAAPLYVQAVREVLAGLEDQQPWSLALEQLLIHLDNQQQKVEDLLIDLLARRDQWLSYIVGEDIQLLIVSLENALQRVMDEIIEKLHTHFPSDIWSELTALSHFAAANLRQTDPSSLICHCIDLDTSNAEITFEQWQGLAQLLLTKESNWRKKITQNEGFPAPSTAKNKEDKLLFENYKKRIATLLEQLQTHDTLRQCFADFLSAPATHYSASQQSILSALITLLPTLVAQLRLVFAQKSMVDYSEISLRALQALGEAELPTDLALIMDYRIQHILVDEFQDTSVLHQRILERLTAGWQPHDGRTLFLVGDPMQSIYRFRKAEVGLFIRAKQQGIANIILESLTLSANFRADPKLVNWTNRIFAQLFPEEDDISCGAIQFSSANAARLATDDALVQLHVNSSEITNESTIVINIIQHTLLNHPEQSIAILVRARQHLVDIIPALKAAAIPYRAVEIELLSQHSVIQDLLALTKALCHLADKTAWLAILRAPWCGLTLSDLHALVSGNDSKTIWELLCTAHDHLSDEGQQRIARIDKVLANSLAERQRKSLRIYVEGTWLALGGPACLTNSEDLDNATTYFKLLDTLEIGDDINDFAEFENRLARLMAMPTTVKSAVDIMTIHKAKGLEFDTVILPGLNRSSRRDDKSLLMWMERTGEHGVNDLILAPIKATADETDRIYDYVRREENKKSAYEAQRLLYVATTRAKQRLHLIMQCNADENADSGLRQPNQNSLLEHLWPIIFDECSAQYQENLAIKNDAPLIDDLDTFHRQNHLSNKSTLTQDQQHRSSSDDTVNETAIEQTFPINHSADSEKVDAIKLKRLTLDWTSPYLNQVNSNTLLLQKTQQTSPASHYKIMQTNDNSQSIIAELVQLILRQISLEGMTSWSATTLSKRHSAWRSTLLHKGMSIEQLDAALHFLSNTVTRLLVDPRGQWLFAREYQDNSVGHSFSALNNGKIVRAVLDRSFIDDQNVRWLICYSTVSVAPDSLQSFLIEQQHIYHEQLLPYAKQLYEKESRPIRMGLYFPLLNTWHEWSVE